MPRSQKSREDKQYIAKMTSLVDAVRNRARSKHNKTKALAEQYYSSWVQDFNLFQELNTLEDFQNLFQKAWLAAETFASCAEEKQLPSEFSEEEESV